MYREGNDTCVFGVCYYCSRADPVCSSGGYSEGALILWLPSSLKLSKHRHPWQRTYKKDRLATWETDSNYCAKVFFISLLHYRLLHSPFKTLLNSLKVKQSKIYSPRLSSRLLDLVDTAVFDFLMDNGDRHHYELMQGNFHNPAVLLIDNGKSFGNPDVDHIDILAPLYQCCV